MSSLYRKKKNLLKFELEARDRGYAIIAGADEVGRGSLAGPVIAAAVILPWNESFEGVNDSKLLTSAQREKLFPLIAEKAVAFCFGVVEPGEIDRMNIGRASLKAMRLAIENLKIRPDLVFVDGNQIIPLMTIPQRPIIKGDRLSLSIAAASILAKVKRDALMVELAQQYPQFQFERHKGYGTKDHWEALKKYGPTPIHRMSYKGVYASTMVR